MAGDALRVNNNLFSWGSWTFKLAGQLYVGVMSVKFADSRERTKGYGQGQHQAPRGRTRGKYATEPVGIKCFVDTANAIRKQLAALSTTGKSYGEASVPIMVQGFEPGLDPLTVELLDCVYVKTTTDNEEGPEPGTEEIEFDCMKIKRNGLVLFDDAAGAP